MNSWSFLRIRRWSGPVLNEKEKGAMLLLTLFCFFIFSTLCLGLVLLSQIYLRTNGWRKNSVRMDYASENGIKTAFAKFIQSLKNIPCPKIISEEDYEILRTSLKLGRPELLEETLEFSFPIEIRETVEDLEWSSRSVLFLKGVAEKSSFFQSHYELIIDSEGKIRGFSSSKKSQLLGRIDILLGHIPLHAFPLLINKDLNAEEQALFFKSYDIEFIPMTQNFFPLRATFVAEPIIPQDASDLLEKALNIKIFRPQGLSTPKLRQALGLEESNEPVPEGVYLIHNDLGLGGVYVQGDIKEMIAAIEDDFQVISFQMDNDSWVLKFSPARSETYFHCPSGLSFFNLIPLGIIIINGKVESLGGGIVDATGKVVLVKNEEIPSLLQGVNLTLVASEEIKISSHLIRQGVVWREGIPYLKEKGGQLIIFSTGQDLWGSEAREGGITISSDAPSSLELHASLVARGKGFNIAGENKEIKLSGSLQATDYAGSENRLKILLPTSSDILASAGLALSTQSPVILPLLSGSFHWREY